MHRGTRGLLLWIAGGSLTMGGVGWLVAAATETAPSQGVAAGIAVGGGLGAVVQLFVFADGTQTTESVTVQMDGDESSPDTPVPVDLFEAFPDPLLYYGSEQPRVRAVNPEFERVFGISGETVEGQVLANALMTDDTTAIVEAATANERHTCRRICETESGGVSYRVRVVPGGKSQPSGYIHYSVREERMEATETE